MKVVCIKDYKLSERSSVTKGKVYEVLNSDEEWFLINADWNPDGLRGEYPSEITLWFPKSWFSPMFNPETLDNLYAEAAYWG